MRASATASALLALVSLGWGGTATAAVPRTTVVPCEAVLTSSVRLAADVVCPGGVSITLAADGIELNLNGHRVTGPGPVRGTIGVEFTARHVVVRNGRISGWGAGVSAGVDVDDPEPAVLASGTVRQAHITGTGVGVDANVETDLTVRDSRLAGNRVGARAYVGARLLVEGSTVENNVDGVHGFMNAFDGFTVRDSVVRSNRGAGISCGPDGNVAVTGTTVQRNGAGLDVQQCSATVTGSAFVWNRRHITTYVSEGDTVAISCTSFTRDGGPAGFPVAPC